MNGNSNASNESVIYLFAGLASSSPRTARDHKHQVQPKRSSRVNFACASETSDSQYSRVSVISSAQTTYISNAVVITQPKGKIWMKALCVWCKGGYLSLISSLWFDPVLYNKSLLSS
jgi:hypothetical protein